VVWPHGQSNFFSHFNSPRSKIQFTIETESDGVIPLLDVIGVDQQQQEITNPSSRQRGRYKITDMQLSKENFKEKEKLVAGPR
jgi:hypothetical protein